MGRRFSKSGLFLMELVISIGFFAVASAVCVQLFAEAHIVSQKSSDLSMAVMAAESAAEEFKAFPHTAETLGELNGAEALVYYDSGWRLVEREADSAYRAVLAYRAEEGLLSAEISVYAGQEPQPVYQITAKKAVSA